VLFNSMAGIDAVEIQYKSAPDAIVDVITGRIRLFFPTPVINAIPTRTTCGYSP